MIFTRQRYYETGLKSSKPLARRLQKQQADNTIYKIRDPKRSKTRYYEQDKENISKVLQILIYTTMFRG